MSSDATAAVSGNEPNTRSISLAQVREHTTEKSCWIVVHSKVYDVTPFLEEHPGGYDIILTSTGKDATQDFEEIGHSNSAKKLLDKYLIGTFEGGDASKIEYTAPSKPAATSTSTKKDAPSSLIRAFNVVLPILLLIIAIGLNIVYGGKRES